MNISTPEGLITVLRSKNSKLEGDVTLTSKGFEQLVKEVWRHGRAAGYRDALTEASNVDRFKDIFNKFMK